jgi:hypothetical protein
MNLTQVQIEELQQAWKEGMTEIVAFGSMQFGIAMNGRTREVALIMSTDDAEPIIRVLKHAAPSDVAALQKFLDAGGCNDKSAVLVTEADLKGRTTISVSEVLDTARRKVH